MTRTRKGTKGPGWEPWSNRHEREAQRADYEEPAPDWQEDECKGCPACICRLCGGHVATPYVAGQSLDAVVVFACIACGYAPPEANTTDSVPKTP